MRKYFTVLDKEIMFYDGMEQPAAVAKGFDDLYQKLQAEEILLFDNYLGNRNAELIEELNHFNLAPDASEEDYYDLLDEFNLFPATMEGIKRMEVDNRSYGLYKTTYLDDVIDAVKNNRPVKYQRATIAC